MLPTLSISAIPVPIDLVLQQIMVSVTPLSPPAYLPNPPCALQANCQGGVKWMGGVTT